MIAILSVIDNVTVKPGLGAFAIVAIVIASIGGLLMIVGAGIIVAKGTYPFTH